VAFPWEVLNWLGTAGFIACLLPQLVQTLRTRRADDISWGFLVLVLFSSGCVMPYMVHTGNLVFAIAQFVNIVVWAVVLACKAASRGAPRAARQG
jgi:uncharacterized protein with PQ loop repeat